MSQPKADSPDIKGAKATRGTEPEPGTDRPGLKNEKGIHGVFPKCDELFADDSIVLESEPVEGFRRIVGRAAELLGRQLRRDGHAEGAHGLWHAIAVCRHAMYALASHHTVSPIPGREWLAVTLAALLHDAADRKLYPRDPEGHNIRLIVREVFPSLEDRVVALAGYVSASKNGDAIPAEHKESPWVLIPRHSDILEAMGWVGLARTWAYTREVGRPLFATATPRAQTYEELRALSTPEKFQAYSAGGGKSPSMLDHCYDKLLHLERVYHSGNSYLDGIASIRHCGGALREVCLTFGRTGQLPDFDGAEAPRLRASIEGERAFALQMGGAYVAYMQRRAAEMPRGGSGEAGARPPEARSEMGMAQLTAR